MELFILLIAYLIFMLGYVIGSIVGKSEMRRSASKNNVGYYDEYGDFRWKN
jgi:hypothetical protein